MKKYLPENNYFADSEAEEKYKSWLLERYKEIVDSRLKQVASDDFDVFQVNLLCLMDFLRHESLYPIHLSEDNGFHFPIDIINVSIFKFSDSFLIYSFVVSFSLLFLFVF